MIEEICNCLHNFFTEDADKRAGVFAVEGGALSVDFLENGQYFRVIGSKFNDGVFRWPTTTADALADETFTGEIWAMKIPRGVLRLAAEIEEWQEKHGTAGAYASESFGGYSYSIATNANGSAVTWQDAFKTRLNAWRKV